MRDRDRVIIWIAILGGVFWLVMVRPEPVQQLMRRMGIYWEQLVRGS